MSRTVTFDWTQAHAFLETAETGSLSAAARRLGLSQPTVGRHVAALEQDLGVLLFDRVGKSVVLTAQGRSLLDHVRTMRDAAEKVTLTATGHVQSIAGRISLTASDGFCAYNLPPIVERLRARYPEIEVEVVSSNEVQDLRRRESDIAIRHVRPTHPDLIAKSVRTTTAHLYGAKKYLDRIGRPASPQDIGPHVNFVGFETEDRVRTMLNDKGFALSRDQFTVFTNSGVAGWEMVRQGVGLAVMFREIAELTPDVEAVLPEVVAIEFPLWLVAHRELYTSKRMRLVFDFLADAFSA